VSGQLYAPAALAPGKEYPVSTWYEAQWTPEPIWKRRLTVATPAAGFTRSGHSWTRIETPVAAVKRRQTETNITRNVWTQIKSWLNVHKPTGACSEFSTWKFRVFNVGLVILNLILFVYFPLPVDPCVVPEYLKYCPHNTHHGNYRSQIRRRCSIRIHVLNCVAKPREQGITRFICFSISRGFHGLIHSWWVLSLHFLLDHIHPWCNVSLSG